ncbi:MAG: TolC family protein [Pirellulaceae bacterium]
MFSSLSIRSSWLVGIGLLLLIPGCQSRMFKKRDFYRRQADREVSAIVAQKATDPRWVLPQLDVYMDPRSRYFDPFHPDAPPLPPDDPYSHQYMHCVNGMKGWSHWHDNGDREEIENDGWYEQLLSYAPVTETGELRLSLDSALTLAYVHSPSYQTQLENLYLSALDVSAERFRLDSQFFGGFDTVYTHLGELRTAAGERNTLSVGRGANATGINSGVPGSGGVRLLEMSRRFPTAGTMLVGFANSFVWQFTGTNTDLTTSILNFNLVQPLLRQAGRDIALEQLTIVERAMLSNMRAMQRYRQGFYTQVAIGQLGVTGPQRRGGFFGGTGLTGFTGQGSGGLGGVGEATGFGRGGLGTTGGGGAGAGSGFAGGGAGTVGGFIGLLQQLQQIRNTQDSLNRQLRTLSLLEANLQAGVIDLTQVDQFRQNIETERANLLQAQNDLQNSVEAYMTGTLGLPPDLPIELDDTLIRQFQFVDPSLTAVQDEVADLQVAVGQLPIDVTADPLREVIGRARAIQTAVAEHLRVVSDDLQRLEDAAVQRERGMTAEEQAQFQSERRLLKTNFDDLDGRLQRLGEQLAALESGLTDANTADSFRAIVIWLTDLIKLIQEVTLVQARARLEAVSVDPIQLSSDDAFFIAQTNRLDLMNNRAALVDTWRLIAFNADALQANLNVVFSGDVRTHHDNLFDFRGKTGILTAGLQFDAPLTRLLERNNYRQSLISYQQDRRQFIQFRDSIHLSLRQTLRRLDQLRTNLEIQRRAMAISIRRVDLTQEQFNEPVPPPQPGQPPAQFGPTASLNLLTALSDLRNTQNNFMSVWLNYHATRMALLRDLGIMVIDENGQWIDLPLDQIERSDAELLPLPPSVPLEWLRDAPLTPDEPAGDNPAGPGGPAIPEAPPTVMISYDPSN